MNDETILNLFWIRSEQSIVETDKKYGSMCASLATSIVFNLQDAEECVNDTYLALWSTIPPARPNVFSAFIAKITRNIAMKKITYLNAQKRSVKATISFSELDECVKSADSMDNKVELEDLAKHLELFLCSIDYESRNMFLRRYWYFDSIKEIAKRFNVSESKVKSQLFRTRNKLRQYLIKKGYVNE